MSHHYKKDGKKYPSVTTIISDCTDSSGPLTQWASNMTVEWIKQNAHFERIWHTDKYKDCYCILPDELNDARFNFKKVSQKALDIGSEVHHAIEEYLKYPKKYENAYPALSTLEAREAFRAFVVWQVEVDLKPISLEQIVWGNRWAGTLDMICYLEGIKTVVDFKTSKDFYWGSMGPQIAAYRSVTDAKRCGILRLDKESGLPFYRDRSKHYDTDLAIFNCMVEIYFLRHPKIRSQFENTIPF